MRVALKLPTEDVHHPDEFLTGPAIMEAARVVEDLGFAATYVTDHPFPDAAWLESGGHYALDPFVALSFASAATSEVRLETSLLILPYRNPFIAAKSIATLDRLSGGRVNAGVGTGYLPGEYATLGADFANRNDVADEVLLAMKLAWRGEVITWQGTYFQAPGNQMLPTPLQQPHPPLLVGGNSRLAMERAARFADGWIPLETPAAATKRRRTAAIDSPAALRERIGRLWEMEAELGRSAPLSIHFVPTRFSLWGLVGQPAELERAVTGWAEAGVEALSVDVVATSRAEWRDNAQRFAKALKAVPCVTL